MELRGLNISGTQNLTYTVQVFNSTKNKVLGNLAVNGNQTNLTVPFNSPGFNSSTDLATNDQIQVRLLREGCLPLVSHVYTYDPSSPVNFVADNATSTHYGLVRFIREDERETEQENVAIDASDLLYTYRKDKIISMVAGENVAVVGGIPVFVQFDTVSNSVVFKRATTRVDGAILQTVLAGQSRYVYLPNRTLLNGFTGSLIVGATYDYNLTTGQLVETTIDSVFPYVGKWLGTVLQFDSAGGGSSVVNNNGDTIDLTTPAIAGVTIANRKFVEFYYENNLTKVKPSLASVHGFVSTGVDINATATVLIPNQKLYGFTGLVPGGIYALYNGSVVPYDEENVAHIPLGIAMSTSILYFSLYLAKLSSTTSLLPPTTITVSQNLKNINVVWTDTNIRRGGFYQIEIRYKIGSGEWSDWDLKNQVEYYELSHIWDEMYIPTGVTQVGARVRYLRPDNQASVFIEGQTNYDSGTPVVTQTQYEILPGAGRWYSPLGVITETQYEILPGAGRWYSSVEIPPVLVTPNAPDPISIARYNTTSLDILVSDNNAGIDQYEYSFREYGTSTWYTLKLDGSLSTNATNPLLIIFAENTIQSNRRVNITNNLFLNKRIEVRVRTWIGSGVSIVASSWSIPVAEIPIDVNPGTPQKFRRTDKINITSTPASFGQVTLTDITSDVDGSFTAYYYVNGRPYKDGSGNRKKFENETFRPGLLIEVSKIFVDLAHFPNWASLEDTMYIAAMTGGNPEWINSYAQEEIIT